MADNKVPVMTTTISTAENPGGQQVSLSSALQVQPSVNPEIPPGVARAAIVSQHLTPIYRWGIFLSIFLVGFSYGLASSLVNVYQSYATAGYQTHSLLATSNTLRTVFAVVAQPTAAKLTDILGRYEIIYLCAAFWLVGLIVQAASSDVVTFVAGAVLTQMGLSTTQVMVEVVVADFSSTRARLLLYTVPNLHFIVTLWISGNISASILATSTWRWGIGMWCMVYTVCILPFIAFMILAERHAHRQGALVIRSDLKTLFRNFFWQIDGPGLIVLVAALALILTPVSLAGGVSAQWRSANVIAPIVVGLLCVPAFVLWELRAPHPLVPFKHLQDRSLWGAMGVAVFFNFAAALQRGYLYTVLVVAFDFSITAATRISIIYSFMAFVTGPVAGLVVYRFRHLRPFLLSGVTFFTVAFGLLVRFRGGDGVTEQAGVIAGQVLLGFGGGLFSYAASVGMQVSLKHQHVAVMIALYLAAHNVGNGIGSSLSGAIWNQVLPAALASKLGDAALAAKVFANPFALATQYPMGTSTRIAIVESYQHVQRILCATGLGLCVPLIGFAAVIRNPALNDEQTLVNDDSAPIQKSPVEYSKD